MYHFPWFYTTQRRKQNGYSQEQLADKIGIARQTISKWENRQAVPELNGLILLIELYGVTIDRIVKEALMAMPKELPFRGPEIYTKGDYVYHCRVNGDFIWFQGYEEIFYMENKIYECYFHGGTI